MTDPSLKQLLRRFIRLARRERILSCDVIKFLDGEMTLTAAQRNIVEGFAKVKEKHSGEIEMVLREALVEELIEAEKEAFKTGFAAGSTHAIKGVPEFYLVQKEKRDKMEFLKFKTLVERKFIYKVDTKSTAIELDL